MRVHLLILVSALLGVGAGCTSEEIPATDGSAAASPAAGPGARIAFAELEHDFGEVLEGETAEHAFAFKNVGTAELEVISARGS